MWVLGRGVQRLGGLLGLPASHLPRAGAMPSAHARRRRQRSHLKGVIPLEGCVCRSVPRKSNEFTITNPDQDSGSINLLSREGKNKQTYVWQTRTPEEAARWIMALQKATQGKQSLRPTLDAQEKLRSAASTDEYARALAGVNEEEIEVPVSWVHHAVYDEMDAAEDTQTRSSLEVASAVANAERRMGTGSGYAPALTGRRPSGPGTQSGRWSSQETAARLASASERVRVTLLQLDRDMRRDTLCLNGTRIECATASHLLLRLARSLLDAYSDSQRVTKEGDGAAAASRSKRRRQSTVAAVARALQERREAKALEFAREVLLGCSRTRTGGDSFDAIDLVFGNHELVTVRPISTTEENPIDLRVGAWDDAEGEEELRRGPSGLKGGPHAHAAGRAVGGAGAGVKRLIGAQDEPLAASHTEWVPDNHSNRCMLCTGSFTFKNRRHHCRVCGILVCGNCSCSTLYDHRHEKRVRVCDSCFTARESGKDSGTLARSASSTSNRFTVDDDSTNTEWMCACASACAACVVAAPRVTPPSRASLRVHRAHGHAHGGDPVRTAQHGQRGGHAGAAGHRHRGVHAALRAGPEPRPRQGRAVPQHHHRRVGVRGGGICGLGPR